MGEEYTKVSLANPKDMDKALVNIQRARAMIHRQLRRTEKQTLRVVTLCATRTKCLTTPGTQHLLCKTIVVATSGYTDTEHKHYRQLFNKDRYVYLCDVKLCVSLQYTRLCQVYYLCCCQLQVSPQPLR